MNKSTMIPGANNIDCFLDDYNEAKKLYEQTKEEKYKLRMIQLIDYMKAATTPISLETGA